MITSLRTAARPQPALLTSPPSNSYAPGCVPIYQTLPPSSCAENIFLSVTFTHISPTSGAQAATQTLGSANDEVIGVLGVSGAGVRLRVLSHASGKVVLDETVADATPLRADGRAKAVDAAWLDSYRGKDESKGYRCGPFSCSEAWPGAQSYARIWIIRRGQSPVKVE